jgi:hypothetical protein
VRPGTRRLQHRIEHVACAAHSLALAAEVERVAIDPDDNGDQRLERADVTIVMSEEAQMVVETVERERRLGGDSGQSASSFGSWGSNSP